MSEAFYDIIEMLEFMEDEEFDDEVIEEFAMIYEEICGEPAY